MNKYIINRKGRQPMKLTNDQLKKIYYGAYCFS